MAIKKNETEILEIQEIAFGEIRFNVLGSSPMIMNRFAQKAWQQLLMPSGRKSRATLEQSLKHDPLAEFRGGLYRSRDPKAKTLIHVPNGAFHGALASVALDVPGCAKAKIERLTKVVDFTIDLFGVPQLFMSMVRNSDMNHTPDVRTRPIFPEWAACVTIQYAKSVLTERTISHLFAAAGVIIGVGDWRGQKGGSFGSFKLVNDDDEDFQRIVKTQGREAQLAAFEKPVCFDLDSEELLAWFEAEVARCEKDLPSAKPKTKVFAENKSGELVSV